MKRCPITYETFQGEGDYSQEGLRMLGLKLSKLDRLPFSAQEQRQEALDRAGKMSIQGVQLKLSAVLRMAEHRFEIVDQGGRYIIKPPSADYPDLPENEDLTMRLAATVGIEVPFHGLIYANDGSLSYFVKRFDRVGRKRVPLEDFAQLSGESRETKYESSMEKVAGVIDQFCTFPAVERVKLFERTLFAFLTGNEDMHLKNFSLITRQRRVSLAPAYDFVNSTIALRNPQEELALPLRGKKSTLTRNDFLVYYGRERLQINERVCLDIFERFQKAAPQWNTLLQESFLSGEMKTAYADVLNERWKRLAGVHWHDPSFQACKSA